LRRIAFCFDLQFCRCPLGNHNPMLVLTHNFHLPSRYTHPTNIFICNRVITCFRIKKLWVKTRTLHTANRASPTPQIPPSWKKVFFHISRVGLELFGNSDFEANFCFNSKPSFSFESRRQRTKFPVASKYSYKHKRVGLESKLHRLKI